MGLSDHTEGIAVPIAAAALGAAFVEKHFTLDRSMEGPDHPFASSRDELQRDGRAGSARPRPRWATAPRSGPSEEERQEMYTLARRSLILTRDLPAGTVLERDMLTVKRPGYGIAPKHLELVLGRSLRVDVEADDILTWEMV